MKDNKSFPTYKGKPLVRCGDELFYGNIEDRYVVKMRIKSKKEVNGEEVADKIVIQLMCTDPDISPSKQIEKSVEKHGLYVAMDIAEIWLKRALK